MLEWFSANDIQQNFLQSSEFFMILDRQDRHVWLPGLYTLDPLLGPPLTWAEIFQVHNKYVVEYYYLHKSQSNTPI